MKKLLPIFLSLTFLCLSSCEQTEESAVSYYQSQQTKDLGLPFSDAVQVGNMLYLAGQVGNLPGTLQLAEGGLEAESRQVMENIKRVLEANGSSLDYTIKFTVFIDDIDKWAAFNKVYVEYFNENLPARSAFGAEGLALGAQVEVECIAYIPKQ